MIHRRWLGLIVVLGLGCVCATALADAEPTIVQPFEDADWSIPANIVNTQVIAALEKQGVRLRNQCSDGVFIRRVYLDAIGTLPTPQEADAFLE